MTINVDLPDRLEEEIDLEVGKGRYKSKSELVWDTVRRLLEERKKAKYRKLSVKAQKRLDQARETEEEYNPEEIREKLRIES